MNYLLDTCVVSDFVRGDKNTLFHIRNKSPSDICISTITLMEIEFGLALNLKLAEKIRPILNDFIAPITVLDYCHDDATQSAILRALLKQQGSPIGSYDVLLAGSALNHKLIFVTSNTKEFERINGLKLENWRNA